MDALKAILFGRNLVANVLDLNGFLYDEYNLLDVQQQSELFEENFELDVSRPVCEIINSKYKEIFEMFSEFKSHECWKDPAYFGSRILQAAPAFFKYGYSPEHFLAYCAVVSGVAVMYYEEEENCPYFADAAGNIIGLVLTGHMMTGEFSRAGSWERLRTVAIAVYSLSKTGGNE